MYKCPRQSLISFFILAGCIFSFSTNQAIALGSTLTNGENLDLHGISIHSEQRNDIYVGALFSSTKVDKTSKLLSPEISKRMSLKFVSKYSSRKMARLWKQRIAMNNPKSEWQPMTEEIVKFSGIFKRAMQEGDELNLDFDPVSGTSIYLNGTLFLTIPKVNFYDLLLNVWIGSIPPTKNFKIGISGKNKTSLNDKLISQYESLQPELGRFDDDKAAEDADADQVAKKDEEKPDSKAATKKETAKPKNNQKKKSTNKTNKSASKKNDAKKAETEKSKSKKETDAVVSQLKADLPPATLPVAVTTPPIKLDDIEIGDLGSSKQKSTKPKIKTTPPPSKQKATKKQPAVKEKVALLDVPKQAAFDIDLYSGSYTRELVGQIKKVQWYPKKALVAGEEGEVKIRVTIDKEGAVVEKTIIQRSGSRTLDRAALKMVGKAQPFTAIPDELNTEQFEFDVPLNFSLRN